MVDLQFGSECRHCQLGARHRFGARQSEQRCCAPAVQGWHERGVSLIATRVIFERPVHRTAKGGHQCATGLQTRVPRLRTAVAPSTILQAPTIGLCSILLKSQFWHRIPEASLPQDGLAWGPSFLGCGRLERRVQHQPWGLTDAAFLPALAPAAGPTAAPPVAACGIGSCSGGNVCIACGNRWEGPQPTRPADAAGTAVLSLDDKSAAAAAAVEAAAASVPGVCGQLAAVV